MHSTAERTEETWERENAFILAESLVATEQTLRRRRRIIERRGEMFAPIWLARDPIWTIWDADEDKRPEMWRHFGAPGDLRPLAAYVPRAWFEWALFRGRDPWKLSRESIADQVKAAVVERDWPLCQICGGLIALGEHHLDHIVHYSKGGPGTVENLRLTHDLCNIRRGTRD